MLLLLAKQILEHLSIEIHLRVAVVFERHREILVHRDHSLIVVDERLEFGQLDLRNGADRWTSIEE